MELPAVSLKMILVVHWLLTTWGCLVQWLPLPYLWSNYTVLAIGVWAVAQRDSVDAVTMVLAGMLLTILTDIIHISVSYERSAKYTSFNQDQFRFSVGMAILSLLLKPVSCLFVYQMYKERGGDYNLNLGFPDLSGNRDRTSYQTIDTQEVQQQPGTSADNKNTSRNY